MSSEQKLARSLAALHRHFGENYGLSHDNMIGTLLQPNRGESSCRKNWGRFFTELRIQFQLQIGLERGWVSEKLWDRFLSSREELVNTLNHYQEPPCLLHGDLWAGNVIWNGEHPTFIDPAVYYGSRELATRTGFG